MISVDASRFIDEDELCGIGGGVPTTSDILDARQEAEDCDEDPQDWVDEIMKTAEVNIQSCLQPIIILDYEADQLEVVLVDYVGE